MIATFPSVDSQGRTIWIVDAHGYGKRFVVRANEKLTAFVELELLRQAGEIFRNSPDMKTRIPLVLITFSVLCFALLPKAHAVFPEPDGSYPGGNTAEGAGALNFLTSGLDNTATGSGALQNNTAGNNNTANGHGALFSNRTGSNNAAVGVGALRDNTTGGGNTASGAGALLNNTGSNNVALGFNAGGSPTNGSANVCIGAGVSGVAGESNTTRIKNVYSSVASGRAVYVNSDNKIGTLASTRRVKKDIKPMDKASEAVLALKPVSFRYKKEIDASGTLQFGLVAEEVADINADLVTRDSEGKPETVRYDAVNSMLLNEFLKEHHQVQDLKAIVALQQKQIEALTTGLQKVSAQLEVSKPAPQMVNNP